MKTFKDSTGRMWDVAVNVGTIERVRDTLSLDLVSDDSEAMSRLSADPILLVRTLWLVCEKQAEKNNIDPESFIEAIVGDVIDDATAAMLGAIADFFPSGRRSLLTAATEKTQAVRQKAEALALAKLADPAMESQLEAALSAQMDEQFKKALTRFNTPTSLPDTPEE